jgi:hypothetical protein
MPKELIDYSNTIIYKIYCKDINVTDVYVGHTTNFTKRKYQHKISSNNIKKKLKIYNIIRNNGGWDNWDMIEIAKYNCKDATEARIKEQQHYVLLNSSLNSNPPYVDNTEKFCFTCNIQCYTPKQFEYHMNTNKHNKNVNKEQINSKNEKKYICETCNYITSKKTDFNRHTLTPKHKLAINPLETKNEKIHKIFTCGKCNKEYYDRTGLWRHIKKCNIENTDQENNLDILNKEISDKEIIVLLLKQNAELLEIIKNGSKINN